MVAVVGAANVDIAGFVSGRHLPGDSNPGRVRMDAGGVGLNIACNLGRLGLEVRLYTAYGDDPFSEILKSACEHSNVALERLPGPDGLPTSTYLYVADRNGEMITAVNDMQMHESVTPDRLEPFVQAFDRADIVVTEANLPAETLRWLAGAVRPPIIADTVSVAKVARLAGALGSLYAIKPNRAEAEVLTGCAIRTPEDALRAAKTLNHLGAKRAFITLGADGTAFSDSGAQGILPARPVRAASVNGAGDAFTAGLVWATLRGEDAVSSARAGMAAARIALLSPASVNPALNEEALLAALQEDRQSASPRR